MRGPVTTVHDPVHGSIRVDGFFEDIIGRHEMQRLRGVKQLGDAHLVFPGANHTRFEHCLGAYHLAGRMADSLGLSEDDALTVRSAALLHDICHAPFSHTLESVMEEATGRDHMELAHDLITGRIRTCRREDDDLFGDSDPISDILSGNGIDPEVVCGLISNPETTALDMDQTSLDGGFDHFPSKDYLHQIIHGPVDCDQMDYLMRDSHYTGVTAGHIDLERLLDTMRVRNDRLCIARSGAPAAEGLMVARSLMYTSVYFHQTVRIINRMTVKAVGASGLDLSDIYLWDDSDLSSRLIAAGGPASDLMRRVRGRMVFKRACVLYDVDESTVQLLLRYTSAKERGKLEKELADRAGIDENYVCVEMPSARVLLSEVQIGKTDVSILNPDGRMVNLAKTSPIAKPLQSRDPFGWSAVIACPPEYREKVRKAASHVLGVSL